MSLTGNVELITFLNRLAIVSRTVLLQKLIHHYACTSYPKKALYFQSRETPYVPIVLVWDHIDRLEETLTGSGTSSRVNGIAIQPGVFGPNLLRHSKAVPKAMQRFIAVSLPTLPVYASSNR